MDSQRNLVLTGFMGVGKSTIGTLAAERLSRPFIDMDKEIEARAGKTVSDIFAQDGEAAFRDRERTLCTELADRDSLVIATGGGTLIDPENRERLARNATIVCLTADIDEIMRRLEGVSGRPLLDPADPHTAIGALLSERAGAYASLPWHVDTAERSYDEIVTHVLALAGGRRLEVRALAESYPIHIGLGLLQHVGDVLRASGLPVGSKAVVVSNDIVFPLHGDVAVGSLAAAGYDTGTCIIPDGERHKTLDTVHTIYDALVEQAVDRRGVVVGLGGGVTGDIAGFAAATYLRGIQFIQVPTSLLAMVDASVGGKTGVDLAAGKNLVGAFRQPELVLIDPSVLATLADEEIRSGLAEAIKHGVLGDPSLFLDLASDTLERAFWDSDEAVDRITRALRVKIAIVEEDPLECGRRAVLNLGHTLGHALEFLSGYELRHGEAVAIGLAGAARLAVKVDLAKESLVNDIEGALRHARLPVACPPHGVDEILKAMVRDKKSVGGEPRWVLPQAIGNATTGHAVPEAAVREVVAAMGARRQQ